MTLLRIPATLTKKGILIVLLGFILCLYMILGKSAVSNTVIRAKNSPKVVQVVVDADSLPTDENGDPNTFVMVPQSELRKYMEAAKKAKAEETKSHEVTVSLTKEKANLKKDIKESRFLGARVIPKPDLSLMINTTQSIPTISAPYRLENPSLCSSVPDLSVLIIVHTACKNYQRRLSIRRTWANSSHYEHPIRILFLVGITYNTDNETKHSIEKEFKEFNDLLVGDFNDTYHNLTLKGVMAYKWITERCKNAKMILKVDDDITVNMFRFFQEVYKKYVDKPLHIICNHILSGSMSIIRDIKNKWFVNNRHFKGFSEYPTDYCSGFFVAMTVDLIPSLYESSKITPYFWVDDVYLYGLVPGNVPGVQYIGLKGNWHMLGGQDALKCYRNATRTCPYLALGAGAKREPEDLWHEIMKRQALSTD